MSLLRGTLQVTPSHDSLLSPDDVQKLQKDRKAIIARFLSKILRGVKSRHCIKFQQNGQLSFKKLVSRAPNPSVSNVY